MRNVVIAVCSAIIISTLSGCTAERNEYKEMRRLFDGALLLRKFSIVNQTQASMSCGIFLFVGSASGESKQVPVVYLSPLLKNGQYVTIHLDLTDIRYVLDDDVQIPWCEFTFYSDAWTGYSTTQEFIDTYMHSIIVHCSSKDYAYSVDMNTFR